MDQEVEIISAETRKERIINLIINKRKTIISTLIFFILVLFGFFIYQEYAKGNKEQLANKYNLSIIEYENGNKSKILNSLKEIIEDKDKTYSPLAFFYLLDNDLITSKKEINKYFDILINEIGLDNENKNLTIFKKGLFNSETANENELLNILNPIIKSESIWKPHALYLMAEYYFAKNEKQKSKEFLQKLVSLENISDKIKLEAQKRLRSDLSE
jgi:predicted negative regulator of RcsB-dependent stress response